MLTLKAPNPVLFLVSLVIVIVAWVGAFTHLIPQPSILMTLAYVVLALGCFL